MKKPRYTESRILKEAEAGIAVPELTTVHKRWGFGLCFLYLRNVKK